MKKKAKLNVKANTKTVRNCAVNVKPNGNKLSKFANKINIKLKNRIGKN